MKCPNCHAAVPDGATYCENCGTILTADRAAGKNRQGLRLAGGTAALGRAARLARLNRSYDESELIGARAYNAILVGVLLWGLLVNVLLCTYVGDVYRYIGEVPFFILYLVLAIGGIVLSSRSDNPLLSFLGYNMVVVPLGLVISTAVSVYGGISASVVRDAFLYTMLITAGMIGAVLAFPQLFEKLGGALLGLLIGLVICEVLLLLFRVRQGVTNWIAAGLFSLYIGYDIYRSQQFAKTVDNAVDSALDIYLDIANLFLRLLSIMGKRKD